MKKIILVILVLVSIILFNIEKDSNESMIRFRVISNSNSSKDIIMKEKVVNKISKYIFNDYNDINYTRNNIVSNIDKIDSDINDLFNENNYKMKYDINYGMNYFPLKRYNGKTYKEGEYESLVISIGEAKGNNYWCILYPPLCMIDDNFDDKIEYDFKILKFIKNLF